VTEEYWRQVRPLFEQACDLSGDARKQFLLDLQNTTPEIGELVSQLLVSSQLDDGFLETPPWSVAETSEPRTAFSAGQVLDDRFEVKTLLGSGGVGEVYRAFDRHRNCDVALKTLRPTLINDPDAQRALRNELNLASMISHINVCRLNDITLPRASGQPAFVSMELLHGETLAALLKRKPMSLEEMRQILEQVVSGLSAAHQHNILHRDLKPANIMIARDGERLRVVIMDFGLAREMKAGDDYRTAFSANYFAGTPAYMAPEQLEGKQATVASDIHALGVIMFQMITGKLPFDGPTPIMIASTRLHQDAPRPRSIVKNVDPRWEHAIVRCLERDPQKRPRTAIEILTLLGTAPPKQWPRRVIGASAAITVLVTAVLIFRPHVIDPQAQAAVDLARVAIENRSRDGFTAAIEHYRRAITLDPRWAQPWAELAYAYAAASNARYIDGAIALREARADASNAIRLDPRLAKAHAALGWTQSLDFDEWPKAESELATAVRLDPNDSQIHYWLAVHLRKRGRFQDAERSARTALLLSRQRDPYVWSELAFLYWTWNRQDRMQEHMVEQLKAFPNFTMTRFLNARLLKLQGRFDQAADELTFAEKLGLNPLTVLVERASLALARGDFGEARQLAKRVEEAGRTQPIDGLLLAGVYAGLNDRDSAFERLEEAWRRKDNTLLSLATSPALAPLRGDPRYQRLLQRLHFSPQIMQQIGFNFSSDKGAASQPR